MRPRRESSLLAYGRGAAQGSLSGHPLERP
jgi:hypothetical protein